METAVVGLGKIGLPLAVQFAAKGHRVLGADINPATVEAVNAAREPFPGEADLARRLADVVGRGRLAATTDTAAAVSASRVVVVVVPLVVDSQARPDFRALDAAARAIGAGLLPGTLVSFETTLPVHTTRRRFAPALEAASGLSVGQDLYVCFSPERVFGGRIFADLRRYPKLVGGLDEESARRAIAFYESVLDFDQRPDLARPNGVWDLGSAEAAELAKLAETTYRDVNIALANEFARFADSVGIDVYEVIEASNSQPYSHIHRPGISVGGHCIPVYPRLYMHTDRQATVPSAARRVNDAMPAHAVTMLRELMGGSLADRTVAVLGAAYRGGVKETAFSGVFATVRAIESEGGRPRVHDPLYLDAELTGLGLAPYHLGEPVDAAVVHTDHREYADLGLADLPGVQAIVDGRRITRPEAFPGVRRSVIGAPG